MNAVAGIFVGGRGTRMGGAAKGLLAGPDGRPIVEGMRDMLRGMGLEVVLVGRDSRYDSLGLHVVEDAQRDIGPLGGLIGLLGYAEERHALALACDLPFVDASLVGRLLVAPDAPVVAPRRETVWEPLFARYDAQDVLPVARTRAAEGLHSLQGLLGSVRTHELPLEDDEWPKLRDWDSPEDV